MAVPRVRTTAAGNRAETPKFPLSSRADPASTNEVPTAVLISFDDVVSVGEGNAGIMEKPENTSCIVGSTSESDRHDRPPAVMTDNTDEPVLASHGDSASAINQTDFQKRGSYEEMKLCGYLNKMGDRGLLKTYKTRWCVFDSQRCRLYYYRTPQDLLPLGSIDIANATLNFEADDSTSSGTFYISTGGRMYQLQAKDRHTMMFWLQELQERRRAYSQQRTSLQRDKSLGHVSPTSVQPKMGLVSTQKIKDRSGDPYRGVPPILGPVELPKHSVGESTALTMQQTGVFNLSLTNLKTEIRNQMANLGLRRGASDEAALVNLATEPSQSEPPSQVKSRPTTLITAPSSDHYEPCQSDMSSPVDQTNKTAYGTIKAGFIKKFSRSNTSDLPSPTAVWFENEPVQDYDCAQCCKLHSKLNSVHEELELVENEARASQEVITMLHKQLTAAQMEHSTSDIFLQSKTDKAKLLILNRKDKQLIQLEQLLQEMRDDRDSVLEQLRSKEREVDQLTEQISMFMEMIAAKDQVVMSLTTRVHDLEQNEPIRLTSTTPGNTQDRPCNQPQDTTEPSFTQQATDTPSIDQAAFDKLKDVCQAFETQNKFLNTEILELNEIRTDDLIRESLMFEKFSELEAEFYKTQSKYLLLLDQMKTPKRGSGSSVAESDALISRLIQEAIESENDREEPSSQITNIGGYDRYGFIQQLEESGEELDALSSKAAMAKRRFEEIESKRSDHGVSVSIKWENYLVQHGDRELTRTLELKFLVRQGIPHEYRHRVWKVMTDWRVKSDKELTGPDYYNKLLKSEKFKMNPATKQIELDLLRTLPTNKNFDNVESKGIPCLRRVLKAYSVHNPAIGYCQGLNRVAAISLLYLDEEDAFWCLVNLVECIMPADYYSKTLIGSQTDQRVFKDLLAEKLPRLNTHLDNFGIDLSLITFNWFITIFCDNVPPETMVRIWDTLLYEGNKVLFRYALAFFKICEADLLQLHDFIYIFNFLRKMTSKMTDIHRLSQIAFYELNPFPRRHINAKRALHRIQIKQQLEELERMRDEYVPQHKPSGVDSDDEEDYDTVEALGGKS